MLKVKCLTFFKQKKKMKKGGKFCKSWKENQMLVILGLH